MSNSSAITFKYLDIGPIAAGRGGVQRFFMLIHDIKFTEELFEPSDKWPLEKDRMVETAENPCGATPVTCMKTEAGKEVDFSQHIATCRYLARIHNVNSGDAFKDYVQDLVADEYQGARDLWVKMAFGGGSIDEKKLYTAEELPKALKMFDALYKKFKTEGDDSPYLSTNAAGDKPLWGDTALFGYLHDNIKTGFLKEEELTQYSNLDAMYKAFGAIPEVASWIEAHSSQK